MATLVRCAPEAQASNATSSVCFVSYFITSPPPCAIHAAAEASETVGWAAGPLIRVNGPGLDDQAGSGTGERPRWGELLGFPGRPQLAVTESYS
jgi:hypothetical protein